jgi:hypothetical protein
VITDGQARRRAQDVEELGHRGRPRRVGQRHGGHPAAERRRAEREADDVVAVWNQRQSRHQADAHAGGDKSLQRLVVVGPEGDVRLETGDAAHRLVRVLVGRAVCPHHPALPGEGSQFDVLLAGQRMVDRQHHAERVVRQVQPAQPTVHGPGREVVVPHQQDVDVALAQPGQDVLAVHGPQHHPDVGTAGRERLQRGRQQFDADRGEGAEPDLLRTVGEGPHLLLDRGDLTEEALRAGRQDLTGRRERDTSADPAQQRDPDLPFQRRHLLRHRRLGQVEALGGRREGALLRDGHEDLKAPNVQQPTITSRTRARH